MGRAAQTAGYTAALLGLEVDQLDFMREIGWRPDDGTPIPADGHPWLLSDILAAEGKSIFDGGWREAEPHCHSSVIGHEARVVQGLDQWLLELGYRREGDYYRVLEGASEETVAMFSHGGSSSVALSHMLNIPFPQVCGMLHPDFTSVTVVELPAIVGKTVYPKVRLMNDAAHIAGIEAENIISN
jgi:probable phosphoglycerate mutase